MRSALVVCYTQFATKHPLFYIWEDVEVDWELHYIQEFFRNCKNIDTDVRNDKKKMEYMHISSINGFESEV